VLLVFFAVVGPWVLFAWLKGLPVISGSSVPGSALAVGWWTAVLAAVCLIPALAGILALRRSRLLRLVVGDPPRGLLLWIIWTFGIGVFLAPDFWIAGFPVLLLGAMQGLRTLVPALREEYARYSIAFGAVALMLVVNQVVFLSVGQASMAGMVEAEEDIVPIVEWVGARLPAAITIESEAPGLVEYHLRSGQRVFPGRVVGSADYVISRERSVAGYREIFRPSQTGGDVLETTGGRFALFQRLEPER